ncbi:MAG TPA: efflux RND transporter periplasmic adaptor subunit, partial [Spirochaetia bacterium]|nr:efflux RND transporter periplasmic adaptor subunit [Spirochaetia bacterium]
ADYPGKVINGTIRRLPYVGLLGMDYVETLDNSTRIRFTPTKSMNLKVGDLARATIILEERDNVLYLPPDAVRVFQGRRFVVVQEPDRRRRVDVKIGIESEDRVEIKEGLQEGLTAVGQ